MFLKNFITVFAGNITPAVVAIVSVPIIIERAGLEAFSILTFIWILIGYFSFFDLGIGLGLTHKIAKIKSTSDTIQISSILASGFFFTALTGVIGAVILSLVAENIISSWEFKDERIIESTILALKSAAIAIPIVTLTSALRGIAEAYERFKDSSVIRAFFGAMFFLVPAVLSSDKPNSIFIMAISLVLVRFLMLLAYFIKFKNLFWHDLNFNKVSRKSALDLISYSIWITASNLSSQLISISDRFILSSLLGVATMAYFSVPFDVLLRVLIIPASLVTILFPYFSASIGDNAVESNYKKMLTITIFGSLFFFIPMSFFAREILEIWINTDFAIQAANIFSILAIGFIFVSISHIPLVKLQSAGFTKNVAIMHITQLCLYVPLFYFVVKNFGVLGGASLWCIRSIIDFLILIFLCELKFAKNKA